MDNNQKIFNTEVLTFDGNIKKNSLTISSIFSQVKNHQIAAALIDVASMNEIEDWWNDKGFPEMKSHLYHKALNATGMTLGQLQRSSKEDLIKNIADYFSHSAISNMGMKNTKFIKLFKKELGAEVLKIGGWSEFMLATKREYPPFSGDAFSFAPHCDCIDFGRNSEHWPFKYDTQQIGAFITIQKSSNEAGFKLWNIQPSSRNQLDNWASEYSESKKIEALNKITSITVKPKSGQLCVFNSKNLHAVEQCSSTRLTIGTFLIELADGWKILH